MSLEDRLLEIELDMALIMTVLTDINNTLKNQVKSKETTQIDEKYK